LVLAAMLPGSARSAPQGEPKRVLASLALAGLRPDWVDTAQPQFA